MILDTDYKILESGDLEISIKLGLKEKENLLGDLRDAYFEILDDLSCVTPLRLISDNDKIDLGDLTDSDVFTTLRAGGWNYSHDIWNTLSWFYPDYMTKSWVRELIEKGTVIFKKRGSI